MKNLFSKKIWLLMLVLCFAPLSFAQNYEEGSNRLSLMLGYGKPNSTIMGKEWGGNSISIGGQLLHYFGDNFAFGAEIENLNYAKKNGINAEISNIAAAFRFSFNVNDLQRIYIPIGFGASKMRDTSNSSLDDTSLMGYVGLGLEADIDSINDHFVFGLEGRYYCSHFDSHGIDEDIEYISVLAMLGYRF